jgi:subtilisin family serine protease
MRVQQFGGRAIWGNNFISGSPDTDENGHGTHCSGTIAGSTYGVSKAATLVAVKVLDASGSGTNSGVISGIQWVATNAASLGLSSKSVLSMSLGGSYSAAVNSAVASTVSSGVTVVVAAGNDNANAANYSPASAASAITVGAISSTDARASFSNYGSVLDVFAPGVNVLSSWIGSTTATNTISGTSMATPHVAGLAAYLIALEGLATPAAVVARIKALATSGLVTSPGTGSPNLIAYNGNGA